MTIQCSFLDWCILIGWIQKPRVEDGPTGNLGRADWLSGESLSQHREGRNKTPPPKSPPKSPTQAAGLLKWLVIIQPQGWSWVRRSSQGSRGIWKDARLTHTHWGHEAGLNLPFWWVAHRKNLCEQKKTLIKLSRKKHQETSSLQKIYHNK